MNTKCKTNVITLGITFHATKLQKMADDDRLGARQLGARRAQLFQIRLDDLAAALTLEDVRNLPGHYHELTAERKGRFDYICNGVCNY